MQECETDAECGYGEICCPGDGCDTMCWNPVRK